MPARIIGAIALALACGNAAAFCIVTNAGCMGADGLLLEIGNHYVSPRSGLPVMEIPPGARLAYPGRIREARYCQVLAPGTHCSTETGRLLMERAGKYVDEASGQFVMTVPASDLTAARVRVLRGPVPTVPLMTPQAQAPGGSSAVNALGETSEQAFRRRLGNAWSRDAQEQVLREEQERIAREQGAPRPAPPSPPRYGLNPQTGEVLAPTRSGQYVGPDGRVYMPAGRSGALVPIGR